MLRAAIALLKPYKRAVHTITADNAVKISNQPTQSYGDITQAITGLPISSGDHHLSTSLVIRGQQHIDIVIIFYADAARGNNPAPFDPDAFA